MIYYRFDWKAVVWELFLFERNSRYPDEMQPFIISCRTQSSGGSLGTNYITFLFEHLKDNVITTCELCSCVSCFVSNVYKTQGHNSAAVYPEA